MVNAGMSWAGWMWLAQMVAMSASRLVKLCTGQSSSCVCGMPWLARGLNVGPLRRGRRVWRRRRVCRGRRTGSGLAELGAKNVRVSAIEPGIVETELQSHVTDAGAQEWLESTRDQIDWLAPDDVAEAINFLASQPARVNIQQLTIMPTRQAS